MKTLPIIILLTLIAFSCQKEISAPDIIATLPALTTTAVTSITSTTAASGGNISSDGGAAVTARGVCWSTTANPTIALSTKTTNGTGIGTFTSAITGLIATTVYYVRAYATNSVGTAYGNEISFTTTNTSTALPTVSTAITSAITMTTATSGGNVTNDGGATVTIRGICWSTIANPTIALSTKTSDGTGTGIFTSAITGLTASTLYHVRAYATNSVGTSYGGDSTFTTTGTATIPTITTTAITAITSTTATSGGNISTDGGAPVTARGVCWSTTANPTIALPTKTNDGTGIGTFTSAITGLTASTLYHVRAYATNSVGTAYGNDISFTTSSSTPDVYVAGYEENSNIIPVAKTWKNGVATSLTGGTLVGIAYSIYVSGTDVYAAGSDFGKATVWKNGIATSLTNGSNSADAYSVFVSGTDVYVGGFESNQAVLWKNGTATSLTNGSNPATANSVFVLGSDVYVAGYEGNGTNGIAKIWKNGIATSLTNGTNDAVANSVFVFGTDVYVAGYEYNGTNNVAKIWKNGVATSLTDGSNYAYAQSVFVSGVDVYVAGFEVNGTNYVAKIWKNGTATSLTNGSNNGYAESVFVFGTDVYVAGEEYNGTKTIAKIWKNGIATSLSNVANNAAAYSIFIK